MTINVIALGVNQRADRNRYIWHGSSGSFQVGIKWDYTSTTHHNLNVHNLIKGQVCECKTVNNSHWGLHCAVDRILMPEIGSVTTRTYPYLLPGYILLYRHSPQPTSTSCHMYTRRHPCSNYMKSHNLIKGQVCECKTVNNSHWQTCYEFRCQLSVIMSTYIVHQRCLPITHTQQHECLF
jgi:hypothetical protein